MNRSSRRVSVRSATAPSVLLLVLAACGGAATPPPITTGEPDALTLAPEPVARPVPEDLWTLIPADAMAVIDVDATRVRRWSQYATLRRWLAQYACVDNPDLFGLMDRVERVVGAVRLIDDRMLEGLFLLRGSFSAADVALVARELGDDFTLRERGRLQTYESEREMIALLDERTLAFAVGAWRHDVLSLATSGEGARVRDAQFVQRLTPLVGADGHALLLMAAPSGSPARDVLGDLRRWGGSAASIAQGLAAEPYWGVRATIAADDSALGVTAVAVGGSEQQATDLIDAIGSAFWQAGLFMRLIGLPPILSTATLKHAADTATVELSASGADAATLLGRLEEVVRSSAPSCSPSPSIAVSPTP